MSELSDKLLEFLSEQYIIGRHEQTAVSEATLHEFIKRLAFYLEESDDENAWRYRQ